MHIVLYHNPRCSKSRQALELLNQHKDTHRLELEVVEYLKNPPTVATLEHICTLLNCEPLTIIRSKEKRFSELELTKNTHKTPQEWLHIIAQNPVLLERPIVVADNTRAAVGRPDSTPISQLLATT